MSDGTSDGYRESLENRARQWKLANFGIEVCYTCGQRGPLNTTDPHSFDRYKHIDHMSGEVPARVRFCSQKCLDVNVKMLSAVKAIEEYVGEDSKNILSPAFRVTARELIEEILRKNRRPRV